VTQCDACMVGIARVYKTFDNYMQTLIAGILKTHHNKMIHAL